MVRGFLKLILCGLPLISFGQIPTGYYNTADGLSGQNLKSALNDIIDGHTAFPYSSSNTDVWDILKEADRDPNNPANVIGVYSGFSMDAAAEYANGSGWNREHIWAKSRGDFGTTKGAGTDLHHLRAADISTNSARNNRNFDWAYLPYTDGSGTYQGPTQSSTSDTSWVWEPRDEVKGDVARMIFYMTVRYEGENGEVDLELTDSWLNNTDKSAFQGKASVLAEWHLADPVSDAERARNEVVYSYQNNRNPFIDHPEYFCQIYELWCPEPLVSGQSALVFSEYVEGSSNNKALELANISDETIELSEYSIRKQVNGAGAWGTPFPLSGQVNPWEVFVIVNNAAGDNFKTFADVQTSASIISFNGNDPVGLFKNEILVDVIGVFDGGSSNFAQNVTLVRKEGVVEGSTTYDSSQWEIHPIDTYEFLGGHTSSQMPIPQISGLQLTEYIEGSSYNKGLELSNLGNDDIDLSLYSLKKQTNGVGAWNSELSLMGLLSSGNSYVIVHNFADLQMQMVADITTGASLMTFNGDDVIGLFKEDDLIDVIGVFDAQGNFAKDMTLVRKNENNLPNSSFDWSEWEVHPKNTFTYLGSHGSSPKFLGLIRSKVELSLFPNPCNSYLNVNQEFQVDKIFIFDSLGRQCFSKANLGNSFQLDIQDLKPGLYTINMFGKEKVSVVSFVKQ